MWLVSRACELGRISRARRIQKTADRRNKVQEGALAGADAGRGSEGRSLLGCTSAEAASAGSAASTVGEKDDDKVIALASRGRGCRRAPALAIIKDG